MLTRSFASRFESGSSIRNAVRLAGRSPGPSRRAGAGRPRARPGAGRAAPRGRAAAPPRSTRVAISSFGRPAHLEPVAEVLADGHVRVERVALEDHRDVAVARRQVGDVAAADRDRPRGHLLEPGDHAQERRLAAARGPDEHHELAVCDLERRRRRRRRTPPQNSFVSRSTRISAITRPPGLRRRRRPCGSPGASSSTTMSASAPGRREPRSGRRAIRAGTAVAAPTASARGTPSACSLRTASIKARALPARTPSSRRATPSRTSTSTPPSR